MSLMVVLSGATLAAQPIASHAPIASRQHAMSAENQALAKRVGIWDATFTSWAKPGARPTVTIGLVADRRMYGEMLQEVLRGPGFVRVDDLTFNALEGRWNYVSMDSRVPYGLLMPAWSIDRDPANRIFLNFEPFALPGPSGSGELTRMQQIVILRDADHEVKDQYFTPAGGSKWLAKRYRYTRRR